MCLNQYRFFSVSFILFNFYYCSLAFYQSISEYDPFEYEPQTHRWYLYKKAETFGRFQADLKSGMCFGDLWGKWTVESSLSLQNAWQGF